MGPGCYWPPCGWTQAATREQAEVIRELAWKVAALRVARPLCEPPRPRSAPVRRLATLLAILRGLGGGAGQPASGAPPRVGAPDCARGPLPTWEGVEHPKRSALRQDRG
eukprot:14188399-Alexandrium_andersonii.AAC.1